MRMLSILLLSAVLFGFTDPKDYPQDYFQSPLSNSVLLLSGTFGELRPNHFHAGIDIKAKVGDPLFAAAEGYVAKIEIDKSGYGKALYIAHPNGYTTLYAHMNNFTPAIETYVKQMQYKRKEFEMELKPSPDQFVFKKGDKIGAVGLTGATLGPHLHFEVHDTKTDDPINPLLFGFKVYDNRPPQMQQLKVYQLNEKHQTLQEQLKSLTGGGNAYRISGDTIIVNSTEVGFGLKAYDPMDNVSNRNGIYQMSIFQNDSLVYQFNMERFPDEDTRYLNAHLDYAERLDGNGYFYRGYVLPHNELPIYLHKKNNGVIHLFENQTSSIGIQMKDWHGNVSTLHFFVKREAVANELPELDYDFIIPHYEETIIQDGDLELFFPVGIFYEDLHLKYEATGSESGFAPSYIINDRSIPVHDYFGLGIRAQNLPERLKDKAFICYRDRTNCGGKWRDDMLYAGVRALGKFTIEVDTIAPTIRPSRFKSYMRGYSSMSFKIWDNFSTAGNVPGLRYNATVDGEWILLEYDSKNALLKHTFDGTIKAGKHQFRLVVTDALGNEQVFERTFTL